MAIATYDDAQLLLRLYDLRREEKLRAAREWFVKNFRFQTVEEMMKACPPGSPENAYMRQCTSYWEMVASFINSGVLHAELFFQSNRELLLVWVRLEHLIPQMRAANQDPSAWRNLENVAKMYIEYMERIGPETYPAFVKRVK